MGGGGGGSILLLDRKARFSASRNDTTATAQSKDGNTMAVSFWVADPPQLSFFSIHCTYPTGERCFFSISPRVVGADGPFVLLRGVFNRSSRREYFLYKAAGDPSLERIPCPGDRDDLRDVKELGILTHGGHNNYLLAAVRDAPSSDGYQLQIYSSETTSWTTRTLPNPCPGVDRVIPDKVITLGGTQLGWVDLSHGILVCDLPLLLQHRPDDDDYPTAAAAASFFIPLPEPLPGNRYKLKYPIPPTRKVRIHPLADPPFRSASWFRDLTCVNGGVLKLIEIENPPPENNEDNVIYGSDLIMSLKRKAIDGNPEQQLSSFRDAWRAVTWTLKLVSSLPTDLFWRQTSCTAHVSEIKDGEEGTQQLTDLYSAFPILSPDDDGILHLKSLLEPSQCDGWVVAVDIGNKSLKAIEPYCFPVGAYYRPEHPFRACTLSCHLDMTNPGIQVSAYREITEASSSANYPGETSIHVGSYKPSTTLPSISESFAKIERTLNKAGICPVENNLPQQQCFNKCDYAPGYSSWARQNNVPPQQCFNKPDGPCGPGYASLAPVHGRHNYQPLWPPSNHQLTPSSEFGPLEAPQPCFNSYHGASYHGYSQPPNLFAYGAHTGYDNYRQQLHPTLDLPIGASFQHAPPVVQRQPNLVRCLKKRRMSRSDLRWFFKSLFKLSLNCVLLIPRVESFFKGFVILILGTCKH